MPIDWKLKIQTFLHDPFDKPLVLFEKGTSGHELRAKELLGILGIEEKWPSEVKEADWNASAANRVWLVKPDGHEPQVDFIKHPALRHPLSGTSYDLSQQGGSLEKSTFDAPKVNAFVEKAKKSVQNSLQKLKSELQDDYKRLFFAIWRCVPETLIEKGDEEYELGQLWTLLPADTRLPDHSIWEHLSTASAIATALPNPALFLFTIGPVQSFIETARKTRDLWMGSYLLSFLIWQAIEVVAEEFGPDAILFPSLWGQPLVDRWLKEKGVSNLPDAHPSLLERPTFPNRFLAILPKENAKETAEKCKNKVQNIWGAIGRSVREKIENEEPSLKENQNWQAIWERQISDAFQTFWISLPWEKDVDSGLKLLGKWIEKKQSGDDLISFLGELKNTYEQLEKNSSKPGMLYGPYYDLLERGMGARKLTRLFSQKEEPGFKCSLCGIRQALSKEAQPSYAELHEFWKKIPPKFQNQILPNGREKLCAVCLTKRLCSASYFEKNGYLAQNARFSSTSTVAVSAFMLNILEKIQEGNCELEIALRNLNNAVSAYMQAVGLNKDSYACTKVYKLAQKLALEDCVRLDGDWFFEETYLQETQENELGGKLSSDEIERLGNAKKALKSFLELAEKEKIFKPPKYFAILYMDGDEMGKWLSGEKAPQLGDTLHRQISPNSLDSRLARLLEKRRPLAPSIHSAISRSLANFSLHVVSHIVEERYAGKVVYAGGDDVIAMVPLEDLLDVLHELRFSFSGVNIIDNGNFRTGGGFVFLKGKLYMMMGEEAEASIGAAIAHHSHSLSHILEEARRAERNAKNELGRNAFSIALLKRSGGVSNIGLKFFSNLHDSVRYTVPLLKDILRFYRSDEVQLSPKLGYHIAEEALLGFPGDKEAPKKELKRILARHFLCKDKQGKELQNLQTNVLNLFEILYQKSPSKAFCEVGEFLQFLSFLARGDVR